MNISGLPLRVVSERSRSVRTPPRPPPSLYTSSFIQRLRSTNVSRRTLIRLLFLSFSLSTQHDYDDHSFTKRTTDYLQNPHTNSISSLSLSPYIISPPICLSPSPSSFLLLSLCLLDLLSSTKQAMFYTHRSPSLRSIYLYVPIKALVGLRGRTHRVIPPR